MDIQRTQSIHFRLVLFITIITLFEHVLVGCQCMVSSTVISLISCVTYVTYFIKEILRIKWDLIIKDPTQTFGIEIVGDFLLLVNILIFIKINKFNDSNNLVIYACIFWIVLFAIKFIQFIKSILYKDRKKFFFFIVIYLALSMFSKENQEILTIVTTLITVVFGRIVLKNIFSNQIDGYNKNKGMSEGAMLDRLEYRIAMANIQLIVAQVIIFLTESIRDKCVYKWILQKLAICDSLFIGLIRLFILTFIYIFFVSKYGKNFKEKVFNLLIKE